MSEYFDALWYFIIGFELIAFLPCLIALCIFVALIFACLHDAESLVGSETPANLQSFDVKGSARHAHDAVMAFARKFGYSIPYTNELRGLLVLHEKTSDFMSPGMFYSVFLSAPNFDQTRVSVGVHDPLIGTLTRAPLPGSISPHQQWFTHQLARELISHTHPAGPDPAIPPAAPGLSTLIWGMVPMHIGIVRIVRAVCAIYILASSVVFIDTLQSPIYDTAEIVRMKSWAKKSADSSVANPYYLLVVSSKYWGEYYVKQDLYERVRVGDTLAVAAYPWSMEWKNVTVLRTKEVISLSLGWGFALIHIIGILFASLLIVFPPETTQTSPLPSI